jgi:hypothetical protein
MPERIITKEDDIVVWSIEEWRVDGEGTGDKVEA